MLFTSRTYLKLLLNNLSAQIAYLCIKLRKAVQRYCNYDLLFIWLK